MYIIFSIILVLVLVFFLWGLFFIEPLHIQELRKNGGDEAVSKYYLMPDW